MLRSATHAPRRCQSAIRNPQSALALVLFLCAGCTGSGRIHLIEQQTRRIDEHRPLIASFRAGECYWWTDEHGRLNVAMRAAPEGMYVGTLCLSLVLTEPPAGSAKEYPFRRETMRASYSFGQVPGSRFRSLRGIAAVWLQPDGSIKGRMRISVQHRRFTLLLGWRAASMMLMMGEFVAVENAERGRALLRASDDEAWPRPPPATSTAPAEGT